LRTSGFRFALINKLLLVNPFWFDRLPIATQLLGLHLNRYTAIEVCTSSDHYTTKTSNGILHLVAQLDHSVITSSSISLIVNPSQPRPGQAAKELD